MKTAVIFPYNAGNAGMYSVDLAAFRLFAEIGGKVDYLVPVGADAFGLFEYGNQTLYKIVDADALKTFDNIVYWGDFTTSPLYGIDDLYRQMVDYDGATSDAMVLDRWRRIFLLKDQDKGSRRIFSFGQNFQTLSFTSDRVDLASLAPCYERFDAFMPRDSHSCDELRRHFPALGSSQVTMGSDCAFLLDHAPGGEKRPRTGNIGFFLYRSNISNPETLAHRMVARGHKLRVMPRWLNAPINNMDAYFQAVINELRNCDAVVTDTYHFAINAIREGATPIVLGRAGATQISTVSDFKKKTLLRDLGAEDLLCEISGDALSDEAIDAILSRIGDVAESRERHPVHETARRQAALARDRFRTAFLG